MLAHRRCAGLVLLASVCLAGCTEQVSRGVAVSQRPTTGAAEPAGLTGQRWVLVAVDHDGEHVIIPPGSNAYIEFDRWGHFSMSDTVNEPLGWLTWTPTGFRVTDAATTLMGVASHGPRAVAAKAMQGVIGRGDAARTEVGARVADGHLVLDVGRDVLSFEHPDPTVRSQGSSRRKATGT